MGNFPKAAAAQAAGGGDCPEGLHSAPPPDLGLEGQGGCTCSLQEGVACERRREVRGGVRAGRQPSARAVMFRPEEL